MTFLGVTDTLDSRLGKFAPLPLLAWNISSRMSVEMLLAGEGLFTSTTVDLLSMAPI